MASRSVRWDRTHRQEKSERQARYRRKVKLEGIAAYGGRCIDCDCSDPDMLEFDHPAGNGNQDRAEVFGRGHSSPGGWNFLVRLRKEGWPAGRVVLRCWPCHNRKHPGRKSPLERRGSPAMQNPKEEVLVAPVKASLEAVPF